MRRSRSKERPQGLKVGVFSTACGILRLRSGQAVGVVARYKPENVPQRLKPIDHAAVTAQLKLCPFKTVSFPDVAELAAQLMLCPFKTVSFPDTPPL
jgi:hypothetical protein